MGKGISKDLVSTNNNPYVAEYTIPQAFLSPTIHPAGAREEFDLHGCDLTFDVLKLLFAKRHGWGEKPNQLTQISVRILKSKNYAEGLTWPG
jgi:hypothetical protein